MVNSILHWLGIVEASNGWILVAIVVWAAAGLGWGYDLGRRRRD